MKKTLIIAVIIMAAVRLSAQEPTKDTVRIHSDRLELTRTEKGKPQFVLYSDDNTKTRKVNTDKGSAERFQSGGTPYIIYNLNEFGERKISKIYVK